MTIKVFKMINGEELIGATTSESAIGYHVDKPANIILQQTADGKMGVGIAPYMPYADGKVFIYKTAIAAEATPDVQMENEYNRLFGSGIQVVGAGALAGL